MPSSVHSLQVSPEFTYDRMHRLTTSGRLRFDGLCPLSHDAHSYYPVLSRQRRASQPIRTLCYKLLFLTSTPFDKMIEMNDGGKALRELQGDFKHFKHIGGRHQHQSNQTASLPCIS